MDNPYKEELLVFQHLSSEKQQRLLEQLKLEYRQIILNYFVADRGIKDKIDKFINNVFDYQLPVAYIIEIHMELIEELSKQLKIEGRSDDILLDYRLTLIDILAHLCEIYRTSAR